jgi:hypothetical protein
MGLVSSVYHANRSTPIPIRVTGKDPCGAPPILADAEVRGWADDAVAAQGIHEYPAMNPIVEQAVPGYDPQAAALHTPRHAKHLHRTAVGRA